MPEHKYCIEISENSLVQCIQGEFLEILQEAHGVEAINNAAEFTPVRLVQQICEKNVGLVLKA